MVETIGLGLITPLVGLDLITVLGLGFRSVILNLGPSFFATSLSPVPCSLSLRLGLIPRNLVSGPTTLVLTLVYPGQITQYLYPWSRYQYHFFVLTLLLLTLFCISGSGLV